MAEGPIDFAAFVMEGEIKSPAQQMFDNARTMTALPPGAKH